jgi:ribonuclease HI
VFVDSEYVMKGITEWIVTWQKKGWKTAAKKPVLNQDLWQRLLAATEDKMLEWKYVAGHSGHKTNDRADEIATSFADDTDIVLYDGAREDYPYL